MMEGGRDRTMTTRMRRKARVVKGMINVLVVPEE
jgi:hypothetical protein